MLKQAQRGKFDVVMAWAIDRVGRSLIDLLGTIQHLEACKVDLYLDQQQIDTTTPSGRLLFQVTGAFGEFERSMIRERVNAGLARAKAQGKTLGRPKNNDPKQRASRGAAAEEGAGHPENCADGRRGDQLRTAHRRRTFSAAFQRLIANE